MEAFYLRNKPTLLIDQALLDDVEGIARGAGNAIMSVYARNFSVEEKEDKSPLTEADKAAHDIIVRGLQALTMLCRDSPKKVLRVLQVSIPKAAIG